MFIPFMTRIANSDRLEPRIGGGGGGKSSGGGGKSSGGGGKSSSGGSTSEPSGSSPSSSKGGTSSTSGGSKTPSSSGPPSGAGKTSTVPLSTSTANGKTSASAYGYGGGPTIVIPAGQTFAGRSAGGGIRSQIYGTRTYGSGYPGILGPGVYGRGFPFWFWPIVWYDTPSGSYLHAPEYGSPSNSSRVGGPMTEATFVSNSTTSTFHVLSDNSTVSSLIASIDANCSSSLSFSSSTSPQVYNTSAPGAPQPEQAIQYYRASSIVLTLDGYNNSATLSGNPNATDSPLPSGIDMTLLGCLNQTIALSAPLVNGVPMSMGPSGVSLLGMLWLVWWILSLQ